MYFVIRKAKRPKHCCLRRSLIWLLDLGSNQGPTD